MIPPPEHRPEHGKGADVRDSARTGRLTPKSKKRRLGVEVAPGDRAPPNGTFASVFPEELAEHRRRHASTVLIVMLDGDRMGTGRRVAELDAACRQREVPVRRTGENVFVFAPTWRRPSPARKGRQPGGGGPGGGG